MANVSTLTSFTGGDLVVSISGEGNGTTTYTDNQATPVTIEELTTSGTPVGQLVLSQNTTTVNGVTENAISSEYGSSSEGSLELSADGRSLTFAGYGVNAATFNAGESNGNNTYGNAALAQSTSVPGGSYTPVSRVVADISYNGFVDTSTALYNIYNTNNPRSVVTVNGSSFYLSGQGVKGDTTQGVFMAQDGASSATPIYTGADTRTIELFNGVYYVSEDSKQNLGKGAIYSLGSSPTTGTTPTALPGMSGTVTLTAAQENSVNGASVGSSVYLSPENYFYANSSTLYVADSGNPKAGGIGDGGLQKWSLVNGTWQLDYTVSQGLNQVADTATAGTTGLIGLTGSVSGNTVTLYATNSTINDTDPTYVFSTTDTLSNTTMPSSETFSTIYTAPADSNVRGIAFAPTCYASGTLIATARGDVRVEDLAIGDEVVTSSGVRRAIVWLGHRVVDCRRDPLATRPIRIAAHAFGESRPARDLYVSPGHAICVDAMGEVLIPAGALVDGVAIAQVEVDTVTYWHVELASHDVILAENLPAESYLDMGNRGFFVESEVVDLAATLDAAVVEVAGFCRPYVSAGSVVDAVRSSLGATAARRAACERAAA